MVAHQETDHRIPFGKQLAEEIEPVTLVNTFHVAPEDADAFVRAWQANGEYMSGRPGYITTQLYRGIGGSTTFINVAVWESSSALRDALSSPGFQQAHRPLPRKNGVLPAPLREGRRPRGL